MQLIHKNAKTEEIEIAFSLLKESALWLKSQKINYWQNWLNPPIKHKKWIEDGFNNNEFYFVYNVEYELVGMYRLQFEDKIFWGPNSEENAGYIHSLTTKRKYYHQGIGNKILTEIEEILSKKGIQYLRLDCGTEIDKLCRYYEKYGFMKIENKVVDEYQVTLYEKEIIKR
jgi:ribosomal protein S18 acetylase RimI-like enzyme